MQLKKVVSSRIKYVKGDITKLKVDAIVNAANKTLLGGGGVDGAIHKAAGIELFSFCQSLNGCESGEAKISPGFNLPAKYIIHTVGPVWNGGKHNEAGILASAYRNSLALAVENGVKTLAFPNISTGVYGFPKRQAAEIALKTVAEFLEQNELPHEVWFVFFDEENHTIYKELATPVGN